MKLIATLLSRIELNPCRFVLLALLALARPAAAQEEAVEDKVYTYVEQMPTLPIGGGTASVVAAIAERLVYPADARQAQIEGRVYISFVVSPVGVVKDVRIIKGLSTSCDEAAVNAVKALPRFIPGKQNGRAVAVSLTVPVTFREPGPGAPAAPAGPPAGVYTYVEQMPALPSAKAAPGKANATVEEKLSGAYAAGQAAVLAAVQKALVLPADVLDGRSEGLVQASFVVAATGEVTDPKIVRGLCPACDAAVLAAVRKLPRFVPGKQNGRAVPVSLSVPVALRSPNHVYRSDEVATRAAFPAPGLYEFLRRNARVPAVVAAENLRGRVRVEFVVRADGKVDAAEAKSHLCASCDAEALRLVRAFPAWQPARDATGQPVATRQFLEIPLPLPNPDAPFSDTEKVYPYVSQMPTLLDGSHDFPAAIGQALRYAEAVRRENIAGAVGVEFVVDADGLVRRPHITRPLCVSCDQAVLEALARIGPFTPGRQGDQNVPVQVQATVQFAPEPAPKK